MNIIRRPNFLVLIKVNEATMKRNILIPIPLFLIGLSLTVLLFISLFLPKRKKTVSKEINKFQLSYSDPVHDIAQIKDQGGITTKEIWNLYKLYFNLRFVGPFECVKVRSGDGTDISIRFY